MDYTDALEAAKAAWYSPEIGTETFVYNGAEIPGHIESGSERVENMVASPALQVRVRQADVPEPAVDDRVVYDDRTYRVGEGGYLEGFDWVLHLIVDYNEYVEV